MSRIRVVVIEDSLTVRRRLVEVLSGDEGFEVVAEGGDGRAAIELTQRHRPDVVTMDIAMPELSGLAATEYLMAYCPTPILIVSASTNRRDVYRTFDALAAGAVDVLDKPSADASEGWEATFLAAVRRASRIRVIRHLKARLTPRESPEPRGAAASAHPSSGASTDRPARILDGPLELVALGASTGGPAALSTILRALGRFPVPILVVQHLNPLFGFAFAEWLATQSKLVIREARDGEPLAGLTGVRVAPADCHLEVVGEALRLNHEETRHYSRPSVDVLFESIARSPFARRTAAGLLTGMGKDGASGLGRLRKAGAYTFAQDEATSTVFGMPREAALQGAAEHVVPLQAIASTLESLRERSR